MRDRYLTLVSYLAKSNFQFISVDATSPVIGIVFCFIFMRVELDISQGTSTKTSATHSDGWPCPFFRRSGYAAQRNDRANEGFTGNIYNLQVRPLPVSVQITQDVKVENHSGCLTVESDLDKDTPNFRIEKVAEERACFHSFFLYYLVFLISLVLTSLLAYFLYEWLESGSKKKTQVK